MVIKSALEEAKRAYTSQLQRERVRRITDMEQVVKHIVLAKFKEEVTEAEIQKLISDYADLRNHIKQIKSFEW